MDDAARELVRRADRFSPLFDPTAPPRVLGRSQATELGYSRHAIDRRVRSGRWRRVLPHTYLTAETLTWSDRLAAAVAFAGSDALLSGAAVLHFADLRGISRPGEVLVLVPQRSGSRSVDWVQVRRTARLPEPDRWYGPPRVSIARALADHALQLSRLDTVRAIVAEAVRTNACTIDEMVRELESGPRRGSALLRQAVAEVSDGAWSAPEARAARLLRRAQVPPFEQNVGLALPGAGRYVGDFVWRQLRGILEIDSRENHFEPADWRATMDRHLALTSLGWSVIHRPPSIVTNEPERFIREVRDWLAGLVRRQR